MSYTVIDRNYQGKPQTGIPIRNTGDYAITTFLGIVALHFLIPPFLVLWAICMAICTGVGILPGVGLLALTHHATHWHVIVVMLMVVGGCIGFYLGCRLTWGFLKSFVKHTRFRYLNGYQGPLGVSRSSRSNI